VVGVPQGLAAQGQLASSMVLHQQSGVVATLGQHLLHYQLAVLALVVYQALVEEYLAVLIYLLTLMAAWAVEDVVGLGAPALLLHLAVAVVATSS